MPATAHHSMRIYPPSPGSARPHAAGLIEAAARLIGLWRSRSAERRALALADYRELRDFGASQWDVEREMAKPFWRG